MNEVSQLALGVNNGSSIEIGRFLIVIVENLREYLFVGRITEGCGGGVYPLPGGVFVLQVGKIFFIFVVP